MVPYRYSPLDESLNEIRLLILHPGEFSADLHVSIHKATLTAEAPPIYEALSYVWGTTENPVDIKVGPSGSETLAITQNLAIALPYLRHNQEIRTLWIDAICVNQQNLRERGSQVKRMADIFRLADRAVVWLGTEKDNSAHILKTLSQLGSEIEVEYRSFTLSPASSDSILHWSDRSKTLPYSDHELQDTGALLCRPWFSRLWVCQEIRLARSNSILMRGFENMLWRTFRKAIFCLFVKQWNCNPYPGVRKIREQIHQVLAMSDIDIEIEGYLCSTIRNLNPCKCSDARDRIYAVLSLLNKCDKDLKIEPDYTQTTAVIYKDVALKYIEHHQCLDILPYCEFQTTGPVDLRSWVPNWDVPLIATGLGDRGKAGGPSKAKARHKEDGFLSVMGLISATVISAEEIICHDYMSLIDEIRRHAPLSLEHSEYVSGESLLDAFVSTLYANTFIHTSSPPLTICPQFEESREFIQKVLQNRDMIPISSLTVDTDAGKYMACAITLCQKRSFIMTKEGYIGIAPSATKPGDQVCVLLGCEKPMVLRPTPSSQHHVIEESYVHGLMYGEAFLGPLPDKYQSIPAINNKGFLYQGYLDRQTGNLQWKDPRIKEEDQVLSQDGLLIVHDGSEGPGAKPDIFQRRGIQLREFDLI